MSLLSPEAVRQALSQDSNDPFLPFVHIVAGAEVYRFVGNTEPITRADGLYKAAPFDITFAEDTDAAASPVTIVLSMVDREVADTLMAFTGIATVRAEIALASSPDIVENGGEFVLKEVLHDSVTLTGTLGFEEATYLQIFPRRTFNPSSHPGQFV